MWELFLTTLAKYFLYIDTTNYLHNLIPCIRFYILSMILLQCHSDLQCNFEDIVLNSSPHIVFQQGTLEATIDRYQENKWKELKYDSSFIILIFMVSLLDTSISERTISDKNDHSNIVHSICFIRYKTSINECLVFNNTKKILAENPIMNIITIK